MKQYNIIDIGIGSAILFVLMAAAAFIPGVPAWIGLPLVLAGAVFMPGMLAAMNLKLKSSPLHLFITYSIGLGLSILMIGGLFINWILPYFGVMHPLARLPVMLFIACITLILFLRAYIFNKGYIIRWAPPKPDAANIFFACAPIAFLIMSIAGSTILNAGGNGIVTLIMLFSIAGYVIALASTKHPINDWTYMFGLYLTGLSLLLMYSLRSSHILGWDINQEYQMFQATLQNLRWKMSYYPGLDYNACMSITILPTIFRELVNIPSEYIFKFVFQLFFAMTPAVVYILAKRYLEPKMAYLAAFLLISQTWFFEQMPALIRQEIAFLFYAVLILAIFDEQLSKRARYILFFVFTTAVILSHYSTAYIWFTLLLFVIVVSYITRFFIPSLRRQPMMINLWMVIIPFIFLLVWQIPLTGTAGKVTNLATNNNTKNVASVATSTAPGGAGVSKPPSQNPILKALAPIIAPAGGFASVIRSAILTSLFMGTSENTAQNVYNAQHYAAANFGAAAGYDVYPNASSSAYVAAPIDQSDNVPQKLPQPIPAAINTIAWIDRFLFVDIFSIIGIIGICVGIKNSKAPASEGTYDFVLLNISGYLLIVLMLFIPYLQLYYNLTRLYLQVFIILTIPTIAGAALVLKSLSRYRMAALGIMTAIMFCSLSGAFDQISGGPARITLDQPPSTLDTPYIHDPEIAAVQWLVANRTANAAVQADDAALLRLQSFGNIAAVNSAIFPASIEKKSYVYLTGINIMRDEASYQYSGNVLVYNYPIEFLDSHKDLIYNSGGSRIYQ